MSRILAVGLSWLVVAGFAAAQTFAEELAKVQADLDAGKTEAAIGTLLDLSGTSVAEEEQSRLEVELRQLASSLEVAARNDLALRAWQGVLAIRSRRHAGRDHMEVVRVMNDVGRCLESLGRAGDALPTYESATQMCRRLVGEGDHAELATCINNLAECLSTLGRLNEALVTFEESLAMSRRVLAGREDAALLTGLGNIADILMRLGRMKDALRHMEEALALAERLYGGRDHESAVTIQNNYASCLMYLGRVEQALPRFEAALAMLRRLHGDDDHPAIASMLNNVAYCLRALGRGEEALRLYEESLAMKRRLFRDLDHPTVALAFNNMAGCLLDLGRPGEALPWGEGALAMQRRLYGSGDHPEVAQSLNNVSICLGGLGRASESLVQAEAAQAMLERLLAGEDHAKLAAMIDSVASALQRLERHRDALPLFERAAAMTERLHAGGDHEDVAKTLANVAYSLRALGRGEEALAHHERALAMLRRIHGARDHAAIATTINNLGLTLHVLGRDEDALKHLESAVAMHARLFGERPHPDVAATLAGTAACLHALGRTEEAHDMCARAVLMMEQLRADTRTSGELRQALFDELKGGGAFELMQDLAVAMGRPAEALHVAERSRARELMDTLDQLRFDPAEAAIGIARLRGDEQRASRIVAVRDELTAVRAEGDRLLHQLVRSDDAGTPDDVSRRAELLARSDATSHRLRQLLDEEARLLGDSQPVGSVPDASQIGAVLGPDELLLEFAVTERGGVVYVLEPSGEVQAVHLPAGAAAIARTLPGLLAACSRAAFGEVRGRDPEASTSGDSVASSNALFQALIPSELWARLRACKRVFIAAHRELHRLPFEALVTGMKDGKPIHWLDDGPPIAYVPSGTVLHWLRMRQAEVQPGATEIDLLAIGDPGAAGTEPKVPEQGVLVVAVPPGGQGASVGLQPHDVLLRYDGQPIVDQAGLGVLRQAVEAAIASGARGATPIEVEVRRAGATLRVEVQPGAIGIQVANAPPRLALQATLGSVAQLQHIEREGDLDRIRRLPRLNGAKAEAEAITKRWHDEGRPSRSLLGDAATEPAVFELAAKAKYLHFACHGIAEEYAGQSLSMLVLTLPEEVGPGDDGLLKLGDLVHSWRGRLASCRLVVLSACRTNVGPTYRDEAPQALPVGFLFAGVPSVISSLWAVDDASTRELMVDFYSRLLAGETDKLAAFTAAKKALRVKYADPFHWAPFLFLGNPK